MDVEKLPNPVETEIGQRRLQLCNEQSAQIVAERARSRALQLSADSARTYETLKTIHAHDSGIETEPIVTRNPVVTMLRVGRYTLHKVADSVHRAA